MLQSEFFIPAQKEDPKDEEAFSAKLFLRGGYITKVHSGVYNYLPLGLRLIRKVENIVRDEMNKIGGQEILMPALHPLHLWEKTGRAESMKSVLYQFEDRLGHKLALGPTHEEVITDIVSGRINSWRDLPRYLYQIQSKFRDEPRARSGLLRGKEFLMKDLYSFHSSKKDMDRYYEKVKEAYFKIFSRCGLDAILTEASGGDFSKEFSHEFMVEAEIGEDKVAKCGKCSFARNIEIYDLKSGKICPDCGARIKVISSIEVGNIFKLGIKFSEAYNARFNDEKGSPRPIVMGCYGIGIGRLAAAASEIHNDGKAVAWPEEISPFKVHLLLLKDDEKLKRMAQDLHRELEKNNIEVLFDDRLSVSPGEKLALSDLLGFPYRLAVSGKNKDKIELFKRKSKEVQLIYAVKVLEEIL